MKFGQALAILARNGGTSPAWSELQRKAEEMAEHHCLPEPMMEKITKATNKDFAMRQIDPNRWLSVLGDLDEAYWDVRVPKPEPTKPSWA